MKKRMIIGLMVGLLVSGFLMTGCTSPSVDDLQGAWQLTSWTDASDFPTSPITLEFDGTQVNGQLPCNSYFGAAEIDGKKISFPPMATTRMACLDLSEADDAAEMRYPQLLEDITSWKIVRGELILSTDGSETLRFSRA